jgi:hypothetical protein
MAIVSIILVLFSLSYSIAYDVIYAVNCGGDRHVDSNGIRYRRDDNEAGVASDYGKGLSIGRAPPQDQILYQTERYHYRDFSYDVPISSEGDYFMVLKFAEVYFQRPNEKVFDVVINNHHAVIKDLDIFSKVGRGVAHDEIIPFTVSQGQLTINDEMSDFDGTLVIEFAKATRDNPKINAIVVAKGKPEEFPVLPPLEVPEPRQPREEVGGEWGQAQSSERKFKRPSGPRSMDPYVTDESWFWPITIVIAIFFPVLFCLCRVR